MKLQNYLLGEAMDNEEQNLKIHFGENLLTNVLLKEYTTIGVGGIADYFIISRNIEELVDCVNYAYKNKIPFLILGDGSNVVVSDYGFPGLVIKNEACSIVINREKGEIIADSGIGLSKILNLAASSELGGIEFVAGVPGRLGGCVYNNCGSKTSGIGDYVKSVTLLEEKSGKIIVTRHNSEWMEFEYRSTKLKKDYKNKEFKPVILTVKLRLARKRKDEILRAIRENLEWKKESQPLAEKSAGSFFKNPGKIKEQSAGFLLDKTGAKKLKSGGASVSKKHANFIVNSKNATAKDIRRLADMMRLNVRESYNIDLEEEVEYIGKW